jgi:hypothetical protein
MSSPSVTQLSSEQSTSIPSSIVIPRQVSINNASGKYIILLVKLGVEINVIVTVLVTVGGVPGVVLSSNDYEDSMKWGKATKCTIVLAEKLFGVDELKTSTISGKKNTTKLDEKVIRAIKGKYFYLRDNITFQNYVADRFLCRRKKLSDIV